MVWRCFAVAQDVESLNRTLCEDLARKQTILQEYMMEMKTGGRRDMKRDLHQVSWLTIFSLAQKPMIFFDFFLIWVFIFALWCVNFCWTCGACDELWACVCVTLFARQKPAVSAGVPLTDVVKKLEEVLEETLFKNIQLKHDLETLGADVDELRKNNQDLRKQLAALGRKWNFALMSCQCAGVDYSHV
jgi:hypothetical protein